MQERKYVWDVLVRTFHWSLLFAFVLSYVSGDEWQSVHVASGYFIVSLVTIRIIWGFIGSKHARFSDFVRSPVKAFEYLKSLLSGKPQHYEGHNPAGGLMVVALLCSILATGFSGLKLLGFDGEGPFAQTEATVSAGLSEPGFLSAADTGLAEKARDTGVGINVQGEQAKGDNDQDDDDRASASDNSRAYSAENDEHGESEGEEFWEEIHEFFVNFTLLLVLLHLGGVYFSSRAHGENLVKAMVTGYKGDDGK